MPQTKSWADLGIDLPEPADEIPDARAWFAQQSPQTQARIVGRGTLALLNDGAITWDDIPRRRTTTGWRPSYAPASLKDLRRSAARRAT
jgi:hypothetical protein